MPREAPALDSADMKFKNKKGVENRSEGSDLLRAQQERTANSCPPTLISIIFAGVEYGSKEAFRNIKPFILLSN